MKLNSISALNFSNDLSKTSAAINRSLERLSTGLRVSRPSDDPGAYSASLHFDSQIRGLTQGNININTSMSLLQTADSGLESQLDILRRLREIAIEGSNGTLTSEDRSNLNAELQALIEEYRRVAVETQFNGTNLLDGSLEDTMVQLGANVNESIEFDIESSMSSDVFRKNVGLGTYNTGATYSSGTAPFAVRAADIDGDGDNDMIMTDLGASSNGTTVSIFKNRGDGTFLARTTVTVGTDPHGLQLGDVTGDGILDIVTADFDDDTVSILAGNGDGTFSTRVTYATGDGPNTVHLADVDSNGSLDIIASDHGNASAGTTVSILRNNGNGTYQTRSTLTVGTGPVEIVAEDLSGDGKVDLAVANIAGGASGVSVYLGGGDGSFLIASTLTTGTTPYGIASGDFDRDGDRDLVVTNSGSNNATLFSNNGSGSFTVTATLTTGTTPRRLVVADINNDGYDDIATANSGATTANVSLFLGNGAFSFSTGTAVNSTGATGIYDIALSDLNDDGVLDIIAPNSGTALTSTASASVGVFLAQKTVISAEADLTVSTQAKAVRLLDILDDAIARLNDNRSSISSIHNRLEFSAANNLLLQESYTDALSRLVETDITLETAELVKNQILQQAQVAVSAQANLQAQVVLGLLRF